MSVVVRRYIDILIIIITFCYSTCISSFLAAASLLLCSFLKCFFVLVVNKPCIPILFLSLIPSCAPARQVATTSVRNRCI